MMEHMAQLGELEIVKKGYFRYSEAVPAESVVGRLEVTRSGTGFVLQEGADDIFITHGNMGKAFHGDWVKAKKIKKRKQNGRTEGEIEEVLQRARTEFVGVIEQGGAGAYFFIADDPRINTDFYIPKDKLNGAEHGHKVLLQLKNWDRRSPEGEVIQVLGKDGDHNAEMHAILFQYGFDPRFPAEVELEVSNVAETISPAEIAQRLDYRSIPTFTIDPEDAKDFDDALSIRPLENGHFEVGVHIADVSHYVIPETQLDRQYFGDVRDISHDVIQGANAVIHLAAISNDSVGNEFENVTNDINCVATSRLARLARESGVRNFVLASSCSVYGAGDADRRRLRGRS